jgi:hypothetical protein
MIVNLMTVSKFSSVSEYDEIRGRNYWRVMGGQGGPAKVMNMQTDHPAHGDSLMVTRLTFPCVQHSPTTLHTLKCIFILNLTTG